MTFTRKNVLRAVWEVEDTESLGRWLGVPRSKLNEIKRQFSNDPQKKKKAYINYFMDHDPAASWRRVIVILDVMKEKEAADKIRGLAEPVTGIYISLIHSYHEEAVRHAHTHTRTHTHTHTHTHTRQTCQPPPPTFLVEGLHFTGYFTFPWLYKLYRYIIRNVILAAHGGRHACIIMAGHETRLLRAIDPRSGHETMASVPS